MMHLRSLLAICLLAMIACAPTLAGPTVEAVGEPDAELVDRRSAAAAPTWPTALITGIAVLLGALAGGWFATRNAKAAIVQKTNELEIASIDNRLSGFVAPFEQLSLENWTMSRELKRRHGGEAFRTLPALLEPGWKDRLAKGDRTLVDAVVKNGSKLRKMILANGGAVSPAVRPHLAAASMHFRMLTLAHAGSLDPDPDRYVAYVYPRQLDGALALERKRLEQRREVLLSQPDVSHPAVGDLVLPAELLLSVEPPPETSEVPTA
jgi:hypothetical protein